MKSGVAIGSAVAIGAVMGNGSARELPFNSYDQELAAEFELQKIINSEALRCVNDCGDIKIPGSLAFDPTSEKGYRVVVPNIASRVETKYDGKDVVHVPNIAMDGTPTPEPSKVERPVLTNLYNPIFKGPSDEPYVALTIDDGYERRNEMLDTIIAENASATFFITGEIMKSDPEFVRRAQESGRITWGNHTYTHGNLTKLSDEQIAYELTSTEQVLKDICGATTIPFSRPPGGATSARSIGTTANLGFGSILWNVSGDAGLQWTAERPQDLVSHYMGLVDAQANPWGSIVLMHFRNSSAPALSLMIQSIRQRGMEPVTLDRLLS